MVFDISPLWISVKVAICATIITFFLGILAARYVCTLKRGRVIIDTLLSLPMVLPPTVVGFFLLIIFGKNSPLGMVLYDMGIRVVFTVGGAVIASVVVSFPIMYRTALGAFEQVDTELIDMARVLGYGERAIFTKVWIPLSWPGIAAGATLSFARSLGEFGATIMIAGNLPGTTRTMSAAVYSAMQSGDRSLAYRWVMIILLISMCILLLMNLWSSSRYRTDDRKKNVMKRMKVTNVSLEEKKQVINTHEDNAGAGRA